MSIHKLSSVLALPKYDVFTVPPTQLQVLEDNQSSHTPVTAITNTTTPIQFITSTYSEEYIDFSLSELYIKIRIDLKKYSSGTDDKISLADWKKICPINYMLNTMWKSVKLEICNVPVTSTSLNYPYIAYFDTLLNSTKESKNTHLTSAMWYKDSSGNMDSICELRSARIRPIDSNELTQSCLIELHGYMHLDLCAQNKAMIGNINLGLTLYPHEPNFYLMYDDSLKPIVRFEQIQFDFHKSKVVPQMVSAHNKALAIATAKYFITRKDCKNFIIQRDTIDYNENNVIKNERLPRKCFLALVNNEAYNGSNNLNPFNFKNYDIQNIRFVMNGKEFPSRGYDCNFPEKLINKAYRGLYESLGQIFNTRCSISRNDWTDGFTIFGFNFTPDLSNGVIRDGYVNPIKVGDLSLHIRFAKPLPETVTVILYFEFDNLIEIPDSRIPFKDFQ